MTTRISTAAAHSMFIANMSRTQTRMADYQMQVNTGMKSQSYAGLGNTSFRLVNLETQREEAEHYIATNTTLELRLNVQQEALTALEKTVLEFRSKLREYEANNVGNTSQEAVDDIQRWAFRAMEQMQDYLNTEVDGQYIFAGGKTQTQPVDLNLTSLEDFQTYYTGINNDGTDATAFIDAVNEPGGGTATDHIYPTTRNGHLDPVRGYYRGDDQTLSYKVDSDSDIDMAVNALDPAFEKAIRAMGLIAQGSYETTAGVNNPGGLQNNLDRVHEALWLLNDALSANLTSRTSTYGNTEESNDFDSVQRVTGFYQVIVNDSVKEQKTYSAFLATQIDKLEKADTASAIVHMKDEQNALEASYHSISTVQKLNLMDYLR